MSGPGASALWVIDSDVLIDDQRDQPQAVVFLEGSELPLAVSVISVAELYAFIGAFILLPLDRLPAQRGWHWRLQ